MPLQASPAELVSYSTMCSAVLKLQLLGLAPSALATLARSVAFNARSRSTIQSFWACSAIAATVRQGDGDGSWTRLVTTYGLSQNGLSHCKDVGGGGCKDCGGGARTQTGHTSCDVSAQGPDRGGIGGAADQGWFGTWRREGRWMLDVGVEDHSLLGSYRSSHLKLTRDFILGFGPYPVLYFYPEKPREMQSSGMSMSPAVETSHPPLAHPPGDGADLHPTPAVDVLIYETLLWPSRPKCLGVRFTVAEMPMGFAMPRVRSSNHSRRLVILLCKLELHCVVVVVVVVEVLVAKVVVVVVEVMIVVQR